MTKEAPFNISYLGVEIQVTPVVNGNDMQYVVNLPTREMTIEMDNEACWVEVPYGRTEMAVAIGDLIERAEM